MIQIDMLMPEGCSECRFETKRGFCKAMPDNFCGYTNDEGRPDWCPLEEQPEIVRCRNCTFRNEINCPQYYRRKELPENWFCADGDRR